MKRSTQHALPALLLCAAAAFSPTQSAAEDIDIFTGAGAGSNANPKILIVLDNTSNWSRMNQKWPGGLSQGQSEARAINTVLGSIGSEVNLGLMEFVTGNPATATGGFIRQAVVPMTDANKSNFSTQLNTIYNNVTDPDEKKNSGTEYGNLMYDAYNYFGGGTAVSPDAVLAAKADPNGYTSTYTRFKSPLSDANACGRNFVIFIGNPNASGPTADTAANGTALAALGGSVSPQLQVPAFSMVTSTTVDNLGYNSQCVASQSACTTTDYAAQCAAGGLYASCSCSSTSTPTRAACPTGKQRYSVVGYTVTGGTPTSDGGINAANPTKGISGCHASPSASDAAGDKGGLSDPVNSVATVAGTTTQINYTNVHYTASTAGPSTAVTQDCPPTVALAPAVAPATNPVTNLLSITSPSTGCYSSINQWPTTDHGTLPSSYPDPYSVSGNTTTRYTITGYDGAIAAVNDCASGKRVTVTQHVTSVATTTTSTPNYKYDVTQTYKKETITTTGSVSTPHALGDTGQCYSSGSDAYSTTSSPVGEFASACGAYNSCASGTPSASADQCTSGTARYMVTGTFTGTNVTPTGTFITPATAANADEWAQFMHRPNVINTASATDTIKQTITTYTIDVFNAQQNAEETELYMSMARVGGGKYFAARNEEAIVTALKKILIEIQSVNTTFASASLPVNATNRTQNANQVFIGMFRPDPDASPRWYGNLTQYAIGKVASGDLDLVDKNNKPATNVLTGFIDDCAASFWTTGSLWPTDSTKNYWANIVVNPDPASKCDATTLTAISGAVYSDLPDGPTVEKGAVAEVLRKGNDPGATPTWTTANRTVLTGTSATLVPFTATGSLGANLVNFTKGVDVINSTPVTTPADPGNNTGLYNASTNPNQTRPSIHGDVVHSRPLPVNYGAAGVTVYYGTNDGMLHAVDASNGKERWAYVAPEFYATNTKLQRLMDNAPGVNYHTEATKNFGPKDYFFDGSIGIYQGATGTNPPVWIYPTQRRGGRMVYAFNVTDPTSNPTLKWRHGCTDGTCDTGFAQMGQTWSTPNVAFINGYSPDKETKPVVVMGGGYDNCEDAQAVTPACGSTKGNAVYFMDADTGALITSFTTTRGVAADVNMIDINNDGLVDYAYVADIGGNIYRIDFVSSPGSPTALPYPSSTDNTSDATHWFMHRVAYTNGSGQGRKFLFGPALFPSGSSTYLAIVSGDREHPLITDYPYTSLPYPNKAYVYKDDLKSTPSTAAVNLDGSDMLNQTELTDATCTSRNLLSNTDKKGWFMYLNQYGDKNANGVTGEQGVTAAVIVGGMVAFSTNRPFSSALSCNTRLGEARGYFVNLFNGSGAIGTANNAACGGSRSTAFAGGGLPPSPVIGLVPIDGVPTAVLIGAVQRDGGSASPIKPSKITPPINRTRTRTYKYIKGDS